MTLSDKSLAGPGYVILNAIRTMNIISFLAVIAASVVMLVKTTTASKFFFFDAVSHVVTAITSMFLLVSELSLFRGFFARNWPLLSPEHGFVTLGMAMVVLGLNVLGNLNKPATSEQSLGLGFWRIVIASGIVVFVLGFINFIASYVFRDTRQGITARQVRAHGAVAAQMTPKPKQMAHSTSSQVGSPITPSKAAKTTLHVVTKPVNHDTFLPSYYSPPAKAEPLPTPKLSPTSRYSRATTCTTKKVFGVFGRSRDRQSLAPPLPINISAPLNTNSQFAHFVQRPDSALHPARTGESEAYRWKA